jgi:phage-related protein
MELPKLNAKFFRTSTGVEPVRDWLTSPPSIERKAIGDEIRTVQFGWPLGMPIVKKMENGLWEVRVRLASRIARVLFTVIEGEMVLLHGFIKQSAKTAQTDLGLARRRRSSLSNL